jgi:hypothetical protein
MLIILFAASAKLCFGKNIDRFPRPLLLTKNPQSIFSLLGVAIEIPL